ncbi:MAG: RluA family pseudouridine synthase [Clostridia bacterium]|nr:RluA family pseudouridine synthase [Clostridia bacterium]
MEILYENKEIVVCIKPSGLPSQEEKGDNMITRLKEQTKASKIYPVHRLDTVTSGVMVYCKTKKAAAFLTKEITENRFHKEYLALVHGTPTPSEGIMEDLLFKDSKKNKSFVVKRERKGVKKASLEYKVLETKGELSLVKIKLHTGRTHQIRVQFSSRRHPVYGDGKYGASDNIPFIALFSSSLTFKEPESGKDMTFSAPLPDWNFF